MQQNKVMKKDRDISKSDWIILMQYEYISYRVRSLLYRAPKDIKKFTDISEKKKGVILDVAKQHNNPSIFSSEEICKHYIDSFFNEWGLPNFKYRDDYQRQNEVGRNRWDREYYFAKDSRVKIKTEDGVYTGNINNYDYKTDIVTVSCAELGIIELSSKEVSRIFDKDFYKEIVK